MAATNQLLSLTANVTVNDGGSLTGDITWDFGDGATATGATVTHAYRSAGRYDVRLSAVGSILSYTGVVISTDAQVTVQDSVTLQPGDNISFSSPYVPFRPPGSLPPPVFGPLNVEVDDASDQPLAVSYTPTASGQSTVATQADLGLALPDRYALQALVSQPRGNSPGLQSCAPAGDQPNQADCFVPLSAMPGGSMRFAVVAADASAVQSLALPSNTTAVLLGPELQGSAGTGVPLLLLDSAADPTSLAWDGATLTITAPRGDAVSVETARRLSPPAGPAVPAVPIDCIVPDDQPSSIQCSLSAIPPVEVSFGTVMQAPSGTFTLPYTDDQGLGTMTITNVGPDMAPGSAAIDVTLVQGGATYSGSGVMRPQGTGYLLAFELSDVAGNGYLYENEVTPDAGGFSGRGSGWTSRMRRRRVRGRSAHPRRNRCRLAPAVSRCRCPIQHLVYRRAHRPTASRRRPVCHSRPLRAISLSDSLRLPPSSCSCSRRMLARRASP